MVLILLLLLLERWAIGRPGQRSSERV